MTFLEAQTAVGEIINQSLADDTLTVTLTSVKRNLNFAYKKVANAIMLVAPEFYGGIVQTDLVANQDIYQLPADCAKLVRVEVGYTTSTTRFPARRESIQERNSTSENSPSDSNAPRFQDFGNYLILDPIPLVGVTAGLRFFYLKQVADLSANGDTFNLPLGYEELPIMYASSKAKLTLGLTAEAQADMAEFRNTVAIMEKELFNRSTMSGNSLVQTLD